MSSGDQMSPDYDRLSELRDMHAQMCKLAADRADELTAVRTQLAAAQAEAQVLREALHFIVNDTPTPGEDAQLTVEGYNRACAALGRPADDSALRALIIRAGHLIYDTDTPPTPEMAADEVLR